MTPEVVSPDDQPKGMSEPARVTGVLFDPAKTFEDIARRPTFVLPLLLTMIMALVFVTLIGQRVGWDRVVRQQVESSPSAAQLPPEQREARIQMGAKVAPMFGYGFILVGLPIGYAIWAGILLGITKGIMAAPLTFKQVFSAIWWASIPGIIFSTLAIVVLYLKPPEDFNMNNPLVFNPGAMMDPATPYKFLYSLATSLDLFFIWTLVLIGLGLKGASGRKLSTGGAMAAVFVPWLVWIFAKASLAGIFS
jgi:Yip1 domain